MASSPRLSAPATTRTTDARRYFADPAGHWLERRRFCCASPGGRLYCLFAWGRLDVEDTEELIEVLEVASEVAEGDRLQLVVLRDVVSVASASMTRFMRYYASRPRYLDGIAREAVVRPEGVVALLAEGFSRVVPQPFPGRVFTREAEALAWLDPGLTGQHGWLATQRQRWLASAVALGPELARLEELLRREGAGLTLATAARGLASSPRTLQRRLREAGTSFVRERDRVLVALAKERLRESDLDIKQIALELGFTAPQRLTELFVREAGCTPGAWREADPEARASATRTPA